MTLTKVAKFASTFLATSALVAVTQIAMANGQGTPVEPPPPPPAPEPMAAPAPEPYVEAAPTLSWQGGYIGGQIGYGFLSGGDDETLSFDTNLDGKFGDVVRNGAGANAFSPGFCDGTAKTNAASGGCDKDDDGGFEGGLRAGYDWQSGNFVYGGLVEFNLHDIDDSVTGFSITPAAYTFRRDLNWTGAARLRAGALLTDTILLYGTGGVAYGDIKHSFTTTNGANSFTELNSDDGQWGWQLGAGLETMITPDISLGVEYLYTQFKDDDYQVAVGPGTAPATNPFLLVNAAGTDMIRDEDRFATHSVRATATYRFGN